MQRKIIPDIVHRQEITSISRSATATQAATAMMNANTAAVIVTDPDGKLAGIVTERDVTRKVVASGTSPSSVTVEDIMTANPDTLSASDSASDALELMQTRGYRHLPVTDGEGKCIGMVSVRDLYDAVKKTLEENIRETEAFVFGDRYSA